jgi:hypothetical protein
VLTNFYFSTSQPQKHTTESFLSCPADNLFFKYPLYCYLPTSISVTKRQQVLSGLNEVSNLSTGQATSNLVQSLPQSSKMNAGTEA